MGAFNINITGVGGHGCERKAKPGDKLYGRCGRFTCPDCAAYDFVQRLRQAGMLREGDAAEGQEIVHSPECQYELGCLCGAIDKVPAGAETYVAPAGTYPDGTHYPAKHYWKKPHQALFTHWPSDEKNRVVDDMLRNERKSGQF